MGEQKLSKSALIIPVRFFQEFFSIHKETVCQSNEAILMYLACNTTVNTVPLVAAGIGCDHEFGTTDKELVATSRFRQTTTISQSLKVNTMRKIHHDYLKELYNQINDIRESVPYRFMKAIMDSKAVMSIYFTMKPYIWPLIRRIINK